MRVDGKGQEADGVLMLDAAEISQLEDALDAEPKVVPDLARLFGRSGTKRAALDELTREAAAAGLYESAVDYTAALSAARKREGNRE